MKLTLTKLKALCCAPFALLRTGISHARVAAGDCMWWFIVRTDRFKLHQIRAALMGDNRVLNEIQNWKRKCEAHDRRAEFYRAQLMQLRVAQKNPTGVRGRIGWMVSAFIPEEVIGKLSVAYPEKQQEFTDTVAKVLVDSALKRIFFVSKQGNVSALIFNPVCTADAPPKEFTLVGTVFETPEGSVRIHDHERKQDYDDKKLLELEELSQLTPAQNGTQEIGI